MLGSKSLHPRTKDGDTRKVRVADKEDSGERGILCCGAGVG